MLKHEAVLGSGLGAQGWLGEPFGTFGVLSGSLGGVCEPFLGPSGAHLALLRPGKEANPVTPSMCNVVQ